MNKPIKHQIDSNTSDDNKKGVSNPNIRHEVDLEKLAETLDAVLPPPIISTGEPCLVDGVPSAVYVYTWESKDEIRN